MVLMKDEANVPVRDAGQVDAEPVGEFEGRALLDLRSDSGISIMSNGSATTVR